MKLITRVSDHRLGGIGFNVQFGDSAFPFDLQNRRYLLQL